MYGDAEFQEYMAKTHTIQNQSRVIAEWNMSVPGNIKEVGNYRNRADGTFSNLPTSWVVDDPYTVGATDADTTITTAFTDSNDDPIVFTERKKKMELLYSLDDCTKRDRPRSGINKPLYIGYTSSDSATAQYINNYGSDIDKRPRYYMASRYDSFKYWTSYRTEGGEEYGVSQQDKTIEDTVPYVVYNNPVPCNRIVIKMQTNVGTVDQGPFRFGNDTQSDPLFGMEKATIPSSWKIQTLSASNNWVDAASLTNADITSHGHVELSLGWKLPDDYRILGEFLRFDSLPISAAPGDAYWVVGANKFYVYERTGGVGSWVEATPVQTWAVESEDFNNNTPVVTELVSENFDRGEFAYIGGIRIVVSNMLNENNTFDLIEFSPRLIADVTDRVSNFNISRTMADLGSKTLPVGDVLVSTGSIEINNNDGAFSHESTESILSGYLFNRVKFSFYESVKRPLDVTTTIPLKTLYSQGFPQATGNFDSVSIQMRDGYGFLESEQAPELFLQDISLSFAVTMLLDSIGFSNYKFLRLPGENETIIPSFFVATGRSVADVLKDLAIATQTSMWFDEKNDFCVASKNWALPSGDERPADGVLAGDSLYTEAGALTSLANIINISSDEKKVANDGKINYTERYLQREKASLEQSMHTNRWSSWVYKPSMLWEAAAEENLRDYNTTANSGKSYNLAAIPLESDIPDNPPYVTADSRLMDNIIDFGEAITWLSRANGYFYANGEIIKFDAVEYSVSGTGVVWLTDNDEYQDYLGSLPFNGKIYPTGRVRIYAEPFYNADGSFKPGVVNQHGREQFGTDIAAHVAGLDPYWESNDFCYGMTMDSEILFTADQVRNYPIDLQTPTAVDSGPSSTIKAHASDRSSIIKNLFADTYQVEKENARFNTTRRGTVQASALVFEGGSDGFVDDISYILKDFGDSAPYRHYGTRMRVIGEISANSNTKQKAVGGQEYVSLQPENPSEAVTLIGGSGGIGIMVDPEENSGYFFEMVALSQDAFNRNVTNPNYAAKLSVTNKNVTITATSETNINPGDQFLIITDTVLPVTGQWKAEGVNATKNVVSLRIEAAEDMSNVDVFIQKVDQQASTMSTLFFYKMMMNDEGVLIPYVLWEGITEILTDDGRFTDIQRFVGQEKSSVYDLGVEFKDENGVRKFFLYLNGKNIGSVSDIYPIASPPNTFAIFTRGKSRCMFNNVYAIADRFSENTAAQVAQNINSVFGAENITNTEAMRKYSMTGFIKQSYLSGIGTEASPDYSMFFEEFGTIMRECDYLNIKYDQAFPALSATLAPVINDNKSYVTSGFIAGAYGAEFLVFNATDTTINLDDETGNFLRIQGVSFTQDTTKTLSVDDYYGQIARLDRPKMSGSQLIGNPTEYKQEYEQILNSRARYGRQEFEELSSEYIQDDAVAEDMISWIVNKTFRPRQLLGVNVFGMSQIQLGDILTVDYQVNPTGATEMEAITNKDKKFVTYQVDYNKTPDGTTSTIFLVEV